MGCFYFMRMREKGTERKQNAMASVPQEAKPAEKTKTKVEPVKVEEPVKEEPKVEVKNEGKKKGQPKEEPKAENLF